MLALIVAAMAVAVVLVFRWLLTEGIAPCGSFGRCG
jgi:hypothetical protein